MENIILDEYCSLDTCHLLRNKGFKVHCDSRFDESNGYKIVYWKDKAIKEFLDFDNSYAYKYKENLEKAYKEEFDNNDSGYYLARPTQDIVIKWLKVNFNICIIVAPKYHSDNSLWYCYEIIFLGQNDYFSNNKLFQGVFQLFKSEEEAKEHAIKYTLKNTI